MASVERMFDVIVIGAGNAGLCAALAAREQGLSVLILERAPLEWRGGNSYFTGGGFRFPYNGIEDIRQVIPDLTPGEIESVEIDAYTADDFYEDLIRVTEYQTDPELASCLVDNAFDTILWMRKKGVRFGLMFGRQSFKVGDKFRFWGGLITEAIGGGVGLVDMLYRAAEEEGCEIWYKARALRLSMNSGRCAGVIAKVNGEETAIKSKSVILASGGFEANPKWRAQFLGPEWDLAKVRGTPYNTGDGIKMALDVGAAPWGNWSGCHAVQWDANAPAYGDRKVTDLFQKHSYPFGVLVNREGKRFVDEGADFRNYTYAKYGREVLKQPGRIAFQIFDSKGTAYWREEYKIAQASRESAMTLQELAQKLEIPTEFFLSTIQSYNAAIQPGDFNPAIKDHKHTLGIEPPKSNWALPIDTPPYYGFAVTCGITFTFGGLHVTRNAEVLDEEGVPKPGLYAAGELVGGIFYENYPGGSGLTNGAVFGRIAGRSASLYARQTTF